MKMRIWFLCITALAFLASGCMTREMYRPSYVDRDDEWIRMVTDYRKEAMKAPDSQEMKASLKRVEFDAAEHFYRAAMDLKSQLRIDEAIAALQKGLAVMPGNEKVSNALAECLALRESGELFRRAAAMKESGNTDEAEALLKKALELNPEDRRIQEQLDEITSGNKGEMDTLLSSAKKITMKFSGSDVKTVFDFIGKTYGINVIYDEGAKNLPVSVSAEEVTLQQALDIVMPAAGVFYKRIGDSVILIAQDTKTKRDQYEDLVIRTFQLNTVKAAEMSNILKNTLNLKRVTANEALNTVAVRDTADVIKLADKVIRANDRKPAEVVFDVEIMEVNRTKAEQLGLNYGSQIKLTLPSFANAGAAAGTAFVDMLRQSALTLPAFTLNFFKQDVDARMLANPRVRVVEGKKAKIHIGDRVPLRSSIIQDATGQVRYTYEYRDIGVMLEVTPRINLDNTVNVALRLEVSTLGSNIGTATEPAYSIGTRDAETTMLLKDGETTILGGLIRDEERKNMMKIPLIGDIPAIGSFFTNSTDNTGTRTDVLLTITPRVVRSWEYLDKELREIYTGTENNLSSKPRYQPVKENGSNNAVKETVLSGVQVDLSSAPEKKDNTAQAGLPVQFFSEPQYTVQTGQQGYVEPAAENISSLDTITYKIAFNADIVRYSGFEAYPGIRVINENREKENSGTVELKLAFEGGGQKEKTVLMGRALFSGAKQGVSYLVILDSKENDREGKEVMPQRKASRIVVR